MRELAAIEMDAVVGGTDNTGKGGSLLNCKPIWDGIGFPIIPCWPSFPPIKLDTTRNPENKNNNPSC